MGGGCHTRAPTRRNRDADTRTTRVNLGVAAASRASCTPPRSQQRLRGDAGPVVELVRCRTGALAGRSRDRAAARSGRARRPGRRRGRRRAPYQVSAPRASARATSEPLPWPRRAISASFAATRPSGGRDLGRAPPALRTRRSPRRGSGGSARAPRLGSAPARLLVDSGPRHAEQFGHLGCRQKTCAQEPMLVSRRTARAHRPRIGTIFEPRRSSRTPGPRTTKARICGPSE
jgi:hypothetical protein